MKLLNIVSYMSLRYGGPPHAVRKITGTMRSLGIDAHCWGTNQNTDENELSQFEAAFKAYPVTWPESWFRSPDLEKALAKGIHSFDVLHLNELWTHPLFAASRSARKNSKPYVMTLHGIFMHAWRYNSPKKRLYLWLIGNKMLGDAACLHALTQAELVGIRNAGYEGPVTIVPNGIDVDEFARLPDREAAEEYFPSLKGKRMIHFLSRLSPEKGLDQLLTVWKAIVCNPSYNDCMLVLSGPDHNGYRQTVESLIQSYGLKKRVLLTGMVSGQTKKALISRTDIYVLPSYTEGFSISVLEHLAASKPALITDACNFPELAKVQAGLSVSAEQEALTAGLQKLLDMASEDLRIMGARGRQLVEAEYRLEITARKLVTVYNCVLNGKQIPLEPHPASIEQLE